jgi:hypothetical protein
VIETYFDRVSDSRKNYNAGKCLFNVLVFPKSDKRDALVQKLEQSFDPRSLSDQEAVRILYNYLNHVGREDREPYLEKLCSEKFLSSIDLLSLGQKLDLEMQTLVYTAPQSSYLKQTLKKALSQSIDQEKNFLGSSMSTSCFTKWL